MKKIIAASLLLAISAGASADYVSPLKFKGLTCEELKQEEQFMISLSLDTSSKMRDIRDSTDTFENRTEYSHQANLHGDIEVGLRALGEAMKRIGCKS